MTLLEKWEPVLNQGIVCQFSPSGHALFLKPLMLNGEALIEEDGLIEAVAVEFEDGRAPFVFRHEDMISPVAWASDDEVVYRLSGPPLGKNPAAYWLLSLADGSTRFIKETFGSASVVYSGTPGHLSVLAEPEGKPGLFDLDVHTGEFRRLPEYDTALETLEIYPLFKHTLCPARREVVLVGRKIDDYLPEGVQYTEENSQWSPMLDQAWMQDYIDVRPDGTEVTQRELTAEAKRKTPHRLYLLGANGSCQEIPETHKASHPCWSPDGTMIAFQRSEHDNYPRYRAFGSHDGLWVVQRDPLDLQMRLGDSSVLPELTVHLSGVLFCQMDNKPRPSETETGTVRRGMSYWESFDFRDGEMRSL